MPVFLISHYLSHHILLKYPFVIFSEIVQFLNKFVLIYFFLGTFVTTDICLQQAINEGYLDVPDVINRLRCQRAGAVQVAKQYAFIHQALVSQLSKQQINKHDDNQHSCGGGNNNATVL